MPPESKTSLLFNHYNLNLNQVGKNYDTTHLVQQVLLYNFWLMKLVLTYLGVKYTN